MTRPSICDLNKGWLYYMPTLTPNPQSYAISIHNQQEFNSAVEYLKQIGFKQKEGNDKEYRDGYTKYAALNDHLEIFGSDGSFVKWRNLPIYQWADLLKGKDPEMETKKFEVGDLVKIEDGSYSLLLDAGGLTHLPGAFCNQTSWVVKCVDKKWPIDYNYSTTPAEFKQNDLLVSDINNVNRFLFINSRLCTLLQRFEKPIMIGKDKVVFNKDGSITVGCTNVDNETLQKIIKKIGVAL